MDTIKPGKTISLLLIMLLLYSVLQYAAPLLINLLQPGSSIYTLLIAVSAATILLVIFFQKFIHKESIYKEFQGNALKDFFAGLLLAAGLCFMGAIILYANGNIQWQDIITDTAILNGTVLMFIIALAEEWMFRGYFQKRLSLVLPVVPSIFIAALIFTLFHLFNPAVSWIAVVNILTGGMVMGCLYAISKSLWMPVAFHFTWNALLGPVLGFPVSGIGFSSLLIMERKGNLLLTGGNFGFEASVVCTLLLLISLLILLIPLKESATSQQPSLLPEK